MAPDSDQFVELRNVTFKRGERLIFDNISLTIERGKITAIMGPSGTGKTTLLRLIGGELKPDSGQVLVDGLVVHELSRKRLFQLRKQMGLMFQSGALFTNLTVFENVAFPLREHTQLRSEALRDAVLMKLQAVGLRGARDLMPSELSGGMARRVAMARSIALDPALMMYDEPFAGQDPISLGVLLKLIRNLNDALGLTSIVVSHDVKETAGIADHMYVISEGKVIGQGKPAALLEDSQPAVRQFLHGLPDGVVPFHYPAKEYAEDLDL